MVLTFQVVIMEMCIIVSIQHVNKSMDGLFCSDNRIATLLRVLQGSLGLMLI